MTALRDRLGRINARVRPGAGGLFAWWSRALAAWLPVRWRAALGLGRDRLLLAHDPEGLQWRLHTVDGVQGPGEMTIRVTPIAPMSSTEISSFRRTTGLSPSSPRYWTRLYVNES